MLWYQNQSRQSITVLGGDYFRTPTKSLALVSFLVLCLQTHDCQTCVTPWYTQATPFLHALDYHRTWLITAIPIHGLVILDRACDNLCWHLHMSILLHVGPLLSDLLVIPLCKSTYCDKQDWALAIASFCWESQGHFCCSFWCVGPLCCCSLPALNSKQHIASAFV